MTDPQTPENKPLRPHYPPDRPIAAPRGNGARPVRLRESVPAAAPAQESAWASGGAPRPVRHTGLWLALALVSFVALCLMGYLITSLYQAYPVFRQKAAIMEKDTFAQGISVDGVSIGGMTRQQAQAALQSSARQTDGGLWLTVRAEEQTWVITPKELPLERNIAAVLDTAYAIGRQGTRDTIASDVTPFEYRYAHLYHTFSSPVSLYTTVTYDPVQLRALVRQMEAQANREAVDAQVATFDFSSRSFTFTQEQAGRRLDGEALYAQLTDALNQRNYTAVIAAQTSPVTPRMTKAELMSSFTRVSSFTTQTTANANRNNNILLAAQAVNGRVVMPGETFSFNEATGERTLEKGYLPAAAIAGGTTVDEVGGGVCQVSSTLFNAAAMADLTIVARSPHSWPSTYVDKGRDATVNWPGLDFQFRNDGTYPIFIVAYYQNRQCTVELYGASLGPGVTIELATRVTAVVDPPDQPLYERNPALAPGTIQQKKQARTGYLVETYKVYWQNGQETRRALLCTSNYPMVQQVMEYN